MNITQMCEQLGLERMPAAFPEIYEQIQDSWREHAAKILSDEFVRETLDSCDALVAYREVVLEAAKNIRENEAISLLVCMLEEWVCQNESLPDGEYQTPEGEGVEYDLLHLFAALPRIPENLAYLRGRKVPEDVIASTMKEYDYCVELNLPKCGRPVFDFGRLNWISRLVHNKLIRIERFKYDLPGKYLPGVQVYQNREGELCILADHLEVHASGRILGSVGHSDPEGSFWANITETEGTVTGHCVTEGMVNREVTILSKDEWKLCLSSQDPVLRIHIPPDGGFDREAICKSYERARRVMAECYPELEYKAFFCSSWLMSADLQQILKPSSNILGFQECFTRLPFPSSGRLVFMFVFPKLSVIPQDYSLLPEETSLQRAIKKLYQSGGYLHEGAGFFF